jgi:hypothetical protein
MQPALSERRELLLRAARRRLLDGRLNLARQAGIVSELARAGVDTDSATLLLGKLAESVRRIEQFCLNPEQ